MKRFTVFAIAAIAVVGSAQADIITQWNFNSIVPDANTGTGTLIPNIGTGTASVVGGVTTTGFNSGDANGGSSDPASGDDSGFQTTTYAATAPNKTAGVQYLTSTVGFEDITVSFDVRHSNTSSRFLQFQYTADGSSWNDFGALLDQNAGDTWFNNNLFDLSAITAVDNNVNFGVRVVAAFGPAGGYVASNPNSSFSSAGTLRYDMVTVNGALPPVVPEPASMVALSVGAMALISRRRNRK
jgi:hypothetical protein